MGYQEALEKAGAKIIEYETFGSYQGDWLAIVKFQRKTRFIHGYYGSCSGCDAFESEFDYGYEQCHEHRWDDEDSEDVKNCQDCKDAKSAAGKKLADFGLNYLNHLLTYDEALNTVSENESWDHEAKEMIEWVKSMGKKHFGE